MASEPGYRGETDELEARFYLGVVKDRIISNVSSWECDSIGLLAHLLTAENCRGRGACTALMKAQMKDFGDRGGRILIGGFRPTSYGIAKRLGFKSVINESEVMHRCLDPSFEKEYFQAGNVSCRDAMWKDWPGVSLLFGAEQGWQLRSVKHRIFGPYDYEDYFLTDMNERSKGSGTARILVTEKGSIVGYSVLSLRSHLKDGFWLLDFFVHPSAVSHIDGLLKAIRFPSGKVRCYAEPDNGEKRDALLRQGFSEKGHKRIKCDGKTLDLIKLELDS
jgi:hypothetical protein